VLPNQITPVTAGVIYFFNLLSIRSLSSENDKITRKIKSGQMHNTIPAPLLILAHHWVLVEEHVKAAFQVNTAHLRLEQYGAPFYLKNPSRRPK